MGKDILRITSQTYLGRKYISLNFRGRWYTPTIEVGNFNWAVICPDKINLVKSNKVEDFKYYELSGELTILYNPTKVDVVDERKVG